MAGAPGVDPAFRHLCPLRQHIQGLIGIFHLNLLFHPVAHLFPEQILHLFFDDKNHLVKTGSFGIIYRKIQNNLAVLCHRIQLLQPAVAGTHAGRHNHQCHRYCPFPAFTPFQNIFSGYLKIFKACSQRAVLRKNGVQNKRILFVFQVLATKSCGETAVAGHTGILGDVLLKKNLLI